jgi:hypothetical protein
MAYGSFFLQKVPHIADMLVMRSAYTIWIGKYQGKRELNLRDPNLDGRLSIKMNGDEIGLNWIHLA